MGNDRIEEFNKFVLRALDADDQHQVRRFIISRWNGELVISHGNQYIPHLLPGFVVLDRKNWIGLVTYQISGQSCEIVTLDSLIEHQGIGTALIEAVKVHARQTMCSRLWLVTTNDNLNALLFYQKRGFELCQLRPKAVEDARKIKPSIPFKGFFGIPIRDELELEMMI